MALMERAPDVATIKALRGQVDVYCLMGTWVARSWPRYKAVPPSEGMLLAQQTFAAAAAITSGLGTWVSDAYRVMTEGDGVTWIDQARSTMMGYPWVGINGP